MDTRTMKLRFPMFSPTLIKWSVVVGVIAMGAITAVVFRDQRLPHVNQLFASATNSAGEAEELAGHDDHAGHEGHDEGNSLELSPQARKNIGLTTAAIKLQPFVRSLSVPAIVIGRPGRAHIEVTATLGGRVTRVYPIEGEAVVPGQPLFDLHLTHSEEAGESRELRVKSRRPCRD